MKKANKLLCIILFLLVIPIAYPITLDELISSYDYAYSSPQINVTSIIHYGNDTDGNLLYDFLILNITVNNTEGNYRFIGDLYSEDKLITTASRTSYLYEGENTIQLYYSPKLLQDGIYNLSLTIQEDYLTIYREEDAYSLDFDNSPPNNPYEQPDVSIEVNSYELVNTDLDPKYELLRIKAAITSTTAGHFEVDAFIADTKTVSSKKAYSLASGINDIDIDFDAKELRRERISSPKLYLITVKDGIDYQFNFNYPLTYDLYQFDAGQSILTDSYSDSKLDQDSDGLAEFLKISIGLDINESGAYKIELEFADLYDNYIKKEAKEFDLNQGEQDVDFRINGTSIYNSRINGPYLLNYVKLSKDNKLLDYVAEPYTTNAYNYDEFERPLMPDLTIRSLEIRDDNIELEIANEGKGYAFGFSIDLFDDNFNPIGKSLIDYLAPDTSESINYDIDMADIKAIYAIVDYDNMVEEENESNNIIAKGLSIKLSLNLTKGWNLISFPLNLTDKTLPTPLKSIEGNYSRLFTYSNDGWVELKDDDKINETLGYWIKMINNDTLEIEGYNLTDISCRIKPSWSLLSYHALNKTELDEGFSQKIRDDNKALLILSYKDMGWLTYSSSRPWNMNSLKNLTGWYGYWVKMID
ncbi:hypothetical protein KY366_06875 [Candidatus Woesearchaeota archaeon]|nr:hypothetical protein [Candidatus Woesearchaeota archaeon]